MYAVLKYPSSLSNVLDSSRGGIKPQNKYSLDILGRHSFYEDAFYIFQMNLGMWERQI